MNDFIKETAQQVEREADSQQRILDEKLMELHTLFEMSKVINSTLNLNSILDNVLLTPMGKMLIARGMILLWNEEKNGYIIERSKGFAKPELSEDFVLDEIDLPTALFVDELNEENQDNLSWAKTLKMKIMLPIRSSERLIGVLALGNKLSGEPFSPSEVAYLQSLANIAAPTIQNVMTVFRLQRVNRQLDKKILELNTLFEIGRELITTLDSEKILNLLSYAIMGEMLVNRLVIFLHDEKGYRLALSKGFKTNENLTELESERVLNEIFNLQEALHLGQDKGAISTETKKLLQRFKIYNLVPMQMQGKTKGVIGIGERITKTPFEMDELDFLTTLGNEGLISLENARLFQEEIKKKRMEEELALAREIQQKLLPTTFPEYDKFEVTGINVSSLQVSGDYFDCIALNDHQVCLAIADVSGKGTPASLLMSNLQATLNVLVEPGLDLVKITEKINAIVHKNTNYDKFITFFICLLDTETGNLKYVNAGHNPPILVGKDKKVEFLSTGGLLLGMLPNAPFECGAAKLQAGDWLVMYTDGVTEAQDSAGNEFGEDSLVKLIQNNMQLSVDEMKNLLLQSVRNFCGTVPQSDDITMVIVRAK